MLYADAGAHSGREPLGMEELLSTWLRAFGIPEDQHQPHRIGLLGQFRSVLRELPGALLILLDDAAPDHPLADLIPADDRHRLLVTVRFVPQDARIARLPLGTLTPAHSRALLAPTTDGPDTDLPDVAEIAELCGHLPLALDVIAARLRTDTAPGATHRVLAALRPPGERLAELDPVRHAFTTSYRALDPQDAALLCHLGLHPGTEIDTGSAAALAGVTPAAAGRSLRRLTRAHLLRPTGDGERVRFHDLLRLYATELAAEEPEAERRAALGRLLDHYAERAADGPSDTWLERERGALAAAVEQAVREGLYERVAPVAEPLAEYLMRRTRTVDALYVLRQDVLAAQHLGAHHREARTLEVMRGQFLLLGHEPEARQCTEAGHLARIRRGVFSPELDYEFGQQAAENGDHRAAARHFRRAARGWRRHGAPHHVSAALSALGWALEGGDDAGAAERAHQEALTAAEAAGDAYLAGHAWLHLAHCALRQHDHTVAVQRLRAGLRPARASGDIRTTIAVLEQLAVAEIESGRPAAAEAPLREAIDLAETHSLHLLRNQLLAVEVTRLKLAADEGGAATLAARLADEPETLPPPPDVPPPPVERTLRHIRPVLLRLFALPAGTALWSLGQLAAAAGSGGPVALWAAQLTLACGTAWGARRVWLRGRGTEFGDLLAVCAHRLHAPAAAALIPWGVQNGAADACLVSAAALTLHSGAQLWPVLRARLRRGR